MVYADINPGEISFQEIVFHLLSKRKMQKFGKLNENEVQ